MQYWFFRRQLGLLGLFGAGCSLLLCLAGCAQKAGLPLEWNSAQSGTSAQDSETAGGQGRKSPAQLQLEVMDFSDRYVASTWAALEGVLAAEQDPRRRAAILAWKVRYSSAAMEIGSGADPRTSLLDMALFVTAGRWALEEYWIPEIFGQEGRRLRSVYADLEQTIWELVANKLTPAQTDLLRALILQWTKENPPAYEISLLRFRNLEGVRAADFQSPRNARGLLASVKAWLGEVNTSLLFGERILFYLERTPRLLAQQSDLTLAQIAESFPLTLVEPDLPALADYVEELPVRMLEGLAAEMQEENGALSNLPDLHGTLGETRDLVAGSTELVSGAAELVGAASLLNSEVRLTLDQVGHLEKQVDWTKVDPEAWRDQISELSAGLASLQRTVETLRILTEETSDVRSPVGRVLDDAESSVSTMLDEIFFRLLVLIGVIFLVGCAWIFLLRGSRTRPAASDTRE